MSLHPDGTSTGVEWDAIIDEAVTEALYSLGLVQHFADENDSFDGIAYPGGGAREMVDVCAEVRAMLREGMAECGYRVVPPEPINDPT